MTSKRLLAALLVETLAAACGKTEPATSQFSPMRPSPAVLPDGTIAPAN